VGFTIATIDIGEVFQSPGVTWVGSMMTCLLAVAYVFILFKHVQAVWRGQIIMEGKDEDVTPSEKMAKIENAADWADPEQGEAVRRGWSNTDMRRRGGGIFNRSRRNLEQTGASVFSGTSCASER
jgi:hypothetical protein